MPRTHARTHARTPFRHSSIGPPTHPPIHPPSLFCVLAFSPPLPEYASFSLSPFTPPFWPRALLGEIGSAARLNSEAMVANDSLQQSPSSAFLPPSLAFSFSFQFLLQGHKEAPEMLLEPDNFERLSSIGSLAIRQSAAFQENRRQTGACCVLCHHMVWYVLVVETRLPPVVRGYMVATVNYRISKWLHQLQPREYVA